MRTIVVLAALMVGCLASQAQTAKVAILSPEDAQMAKSLHDRIVDLEKEKADFDKKIEEKYLKVEREVLEPWCFRNDSSGLISPAPCDVKTAKTHKKEFVLAPGWENGFEFDDKFLSVVPKQKPSIIYSGGMQGYYNCISPTNPL